MSTTARRLQYRPSSGVILHSGDSMRQLDFHQAYAAKPPEYRAELIGGMVFEPSPLSLEHGYYDARLLSICEYYAAHTTGVRCATNATVILGDQDEVQPDILLNIMPEHGGQSGYKRIAKKIYMKGAPEMVAEVAHSSYAIDLHLKKKRYEVGGVLEYVVLCLEPLSLHWFNLKTGRELKPVDGVIKSKIFPGLWISVQALLDLDFEGSMAALREGLETKQYASFKSKLRQAKK